MKIGIIKQKYVSLPEPSDREILRYAGVRDGVSYDGGLLERAKVEVGKVVRSLVVYREMPIEIEDSLVSFGCVSVKSEKLAYAMRRAKRVIFMAATVGVEIDRLIAKKARLSAAEALMLDAVATERIEALCDEFCHSIDSDLLHEGLRTGIRFSPGYGDLPLEFQKEIFSLIAPERYIGLTLNASLMMSPSKSVSAIVAIE